MTGARAYHCEVCDHPDPRWALTRRGDAVRSWACDEDLVTVVDNLQRDHEVSEVVVRDRRKAREWARIGHTLNEISGGEG